MNRFPTKLEKKLEDRKAAQSFRSLGRQNDLTNLSSNDYLGFASRAEIELRTQKLLEGNLLKNGATGSRLLSGNHELYTLTEDFLKSYHLSEAALIYNSGYDANVGFFASVPGRGDLVFYDEAIHASIRDGLSMGYSRAFKFKHNDLDDLRRQLERQSHRTKEDHIFIVTESVFSMDGDSPDLRALAGLAENWQAFLVVDEAHALGVFGKKGEGLVQALGLQEQVFARTMTFGKALGAHGAAILGSRRLKEYLVNFSRSLIYTTALPPHSVASIYAAYEQMAVSAEGEKLQKNIEFFKQQIERNGLRPLFVESKSAIHSCIIPGNAEVRSLAGELEARGFEVKPILSPTVTKGRERLRFCLHSFNSREEISSVLEALAALVRTI